MDEYNRKAKEFLKKVGAKVTISYKDSGKLPDWDTYDYDNYRVRVDRKGKSWSYMYHQTTHRTKKDGRPTPYDVLSCVEQTDPGTIDDFVQDCGYEVHSWNDVRRIERIYKAVCKEAKNFERMFGDVADEFCEVFA